MSGVKQNCVYSVNRQHVACCQCADYYEHTSLRHQFPVALYTSRAAHHAYQSQCILVAEQINGWPNVTREEPSCWRCVGQLRFVGHGHAPYEIGYRYFCKREDCRQKKYTHRRPKYGGNNTTELSKSDGVTTRTFRSSAACVHC